MSQRFTFKKEARETGLRAVGRPHPDTKIKLGGKLVGTICAPFHGTADNKWGVSFMVENEKPGENCPFRWANLKRRFDSEPEAREFVQANTTALLLWKLYAQEDDEG